VLFRTRLIEAEEVPTLTHVGRHRRCHVQDATLRMRYAYAAGVQVQPILDTTREFPIAVGHEIFRISDNWMADVGGMDAQLMRAAGIWLHLQPGKRPRRLVHDTVVGDGVVRALLAMPDHPH